MKRAFSARILCAALVVLSCALAASCLQAGPDDTQSSSGEETGKARERLPIVSYKPEDFPFVTIVADDGKDPGGGWQEARTTLDFKQWVIPHLPRKWQC